MFMIKFDLIFISQFIWSNGQKNLNLNFFTIANQNKFLFNGYLEDN